MSDDRVLIEAGNSVEQIREMLNLFTRRVNQASAAMRALTDTWEIRAPKRLRRPIPAKWRNRQAMYRSMIRTQAHKLAAGTY